MSLNAPTAPAIIASTRYQYSEANVDVPMSTRVGHGKLSPSAANIGANFGRTNIVMMPIAIEIATKTVIG